jgi:2-dehydro-3-deoxyphosphogluconate aldolase/(4S)-4-hydroxy-2-oxoglutarate aldolase
MNQILERVCRAKIIAIARGLPPEPMLALAEALRAGGVEMMEVTFNQAKPETWRDTAASIHEINQRLGSRMEIGAGTVITMEQLHLAREAGASYMVSPNVNPEVIRAAKKLGMAVFPGAMTPTEIEAAYAAGADAVKIFPADSLGPDYIKSVRAPLSHVPLLAVGGVNEKNAGSFLAAGCAGLGIGGNLVNKAWIEAGEWERITDRARDYVKAVQITS